MELITSQLHITGTMIWPICRRFRRGGNGRGGGRGNRRNFRRHRYKKWNKKGHNNQKKRKD